MFFFRLLEATFFFLGALFIITQIVVPGLRGRPLFPFFPLFQRTGDLETRLEEARRAQDEAALERTVREEEAKANSIKKGTDSNPNKE